MLGEFLKVASQFRLGDLPTEQLHPLTRELSSLACSRPDEALGILHRIDAAALSVLAANRDRLRGLAARMGETLRSGSRIHLAGCGSTGRLALACESIWRKTHSGTPLADQVTAFMAGGDSALVRAVEGFEDHPEFGERQLLESRFRDGDLLVAATEGGETPFVIGAVELAAEISSRAPCFLYCNPDEVLSRTVARSARVLADARIEKFCLSVGPMALSGSTRMQASTVLMAAIGYSIQAFLDPDGIEASLQSLACRWQALDTRFLAAFVEREADLYQAGHFLDYEAGPDLAVTLLTDTTERAPTFGFPPFENSRDEADLPAPCDLCLPGSPDSEAAWLALLGRPPRGLEWPDLDGRASREFLLGFDFSRWHAEKRRMLCGPGNHHVFWIALSPPALEFALDGLRHRLDVGGLSMLSIHLVLKMLLNAHSTLVMGRLGRYDGNVMTWVKPGNYKLIDRAVRYADTLLRQRGLGIPYDSLARACFELRDRVPGSKSLVHALVEHFCALRISGARMTMKG